MADHSGYPEGHLEHMMSELEAEGNEILHTTQVTITLPAFEGLCSFLHSGAIMFGIVIGGMALLGSCTSYGLDDTDNRNTGERSALTLRTDHGTGCQYLKSGDNLIPRLDGQGKHVGCR